MKFRLKSLFAVGASGLAVTPLMMAAQPVTAAAFSMFNTSITLNGKLMPSPKAFVYQKTTYMPIYYVNDALNALGVKTSWSYTPAQQTWGLNSGTVVSTTLNLNAKSGTVNVTLNGKTVEEHVVRVAAVDPYSHVLTTYVPIWYIQQILDVLDIKNTWDGRNWRIIGGYTAYTKTGKNLGTYLTLAQAEQALADYTGGTVVENVTGKVYSHNDFANVDLRFPAPNDLNAGTVDQYLRAEKSPMAGLGQVFMDAQVTYGVDVNYLVSHAAEESRWGTSNIALQNNNLFGYGAFDANAGADAGIFPSETYAILFQAWEVRNNYLNPGASHYGNAPTLNGMQQNYASDTQWANTISALMDQFALSVGETVTNYTQYTPGESAPTPAASTEPVFYVNRAAGSTTSNPNYGGTPVYPDIATGANDMFVRTLQNGDSGIDVETLQTALNQQENANLTVDGQFGPNTQQALETFQTNHGYPATGVCDYNLWENALHIPGPMNVLPNGSPVLVDQMMQGLAGGVVSLWYHVQGAGWVDSQYVQFSNVYRLTPANLTAPAEATVSVFSSDGTALTGLHAGDYVVSTNPSVVNGNIQVQFTDQKSQQLISGWIHASDATLTKVN